jgi:hypothetical protein
MRSAIFTVCVCALVVSTSSRPERVAGTFPEKVPGTSESRVFLPVPPSVAIVALPDGGIQPQAVVDAAGIIHLLYFKGEPAGGDLYYVQLTKPDQKTWQPVSVNSIAGSALATGSVRGGQIALGRDGRVHVAWHGSKPIDGKGVSNVPVWYTRSEADGLRFQPQIAVSGAADGIDGSTVAADRSGHVVVAWHAMGNRPGEANRMVYLAKSSDDGATFSGEAPATSAPVGACGCCGIRALFDRAGALHVLYRAATDGRHRDTTWLTVDGITAHRPVRVHPWELEACPMTTYALAETPDGLAAAWETAQQIYSATLSAATGTVVRLSAMPGTGSRKHPSIAVTPAGNRLVAWTEGTAWKRGGTMAWSLSDRNGVQIAAASNAGPVPVWGLVSAVAMLDGSFVIIR